MKVLLFFFSSLSVLFRIFIFRFECCCHRGTFYQHYEDNVNLAFCIVISSLVSSNELKVYRNILNANIALFWDKLNGSRIILHFHSPTPSFHQLSAFKIESSHSQTR